MSDERQIEASVRHAEVAASAIVPWSPARPDEALMAREEPGEFVGAESMRAELWEKLLVFLFADGQPGCWECTAVRGLSLIRHCAPSLLTGRDLSAVAGIRSRAGGKVQQSFGLTEFLADDEGTRMVLRVVLGYLFPEGPEWLKEGCRRIYLLARAFQPQLVQITREVGERVKERDPQTGRMKLTIRHVPKLVEMSYEDMARVFGENTSKARARWSARAQRVIRKPIESNGGACHLAFGKSASTRAKYAARAKGNSNRRKGSVPGDQ